MHYNASMVGFVRSLSLLLLLFTFGCSSQSLEQDGGDLTRSEVEYLSRRLSEAVEKKYSVLQHRKVARYIDSLGQYLVSRNRDLPPLPFGFTVLKTNEVFTLSLPGGQVYVTLGLIKASEYEGELAAAVAHELAHQQLAHALVVWRQRINAVRPNRYFLETEGDFSDIFLGKSGYLALGAGREQEADELAPVILYRANFDPRLYPSYLQRLQRLENDDIGRMYVSISLHPPIMDRITWSKSAILNIPPIRDSRVSSPGFLEIKGILKSVEKYRDASH